MSNRVSFIELDLLKCSNTYGLAPCTASVGVTGSEKCFNCRATCQDPLNIVEASETVRFSKPSSNVRYDLNASPNITIPNIQSIGFTPAVVDLSGGLGVRSTLSVSFQDSRSPDTDASGDPYVNERSYDPYTVGTYFGKFRARYPFIRGRAIRWIQGTDDQLIADMETRSFIVDSVAGPSLGGTFTIKAKDVLKLADGDRSRAPTVAGVSLGSAITSGFTGNVSVGTNGTTPLVGYSWLALSNAESVAFTVVDANTINITARGQLSSESVAHESGAAVQPILYYAPQNPADILHDLLTTWAGIDPAYVPLAEWQQESDDFINRGYSGYIAQPTAVKQLLEELIAQTGSFIWWDAAADNPAAPDGRGFIRWRVLKRPPESSALYDDSAILRGSFNSRDNYPARVSRCFVYFGQRNPLLDLTDTDNYSTTVLRQEIESEVNFENVPAYKTVFSRWIASVSRGTAERLGDLILQRLSIPPRKIGFRLLRDAGSQVPELGAAYRVSSVSLQSFTGAPQTLPFQVTSLSPGDTNVTVEGEEVTFNEVISPDSPNTFNVSLISQNNVNLRDLYDTASGNQEPTALTTVNFTVETGAVVGSTSASVPALRVGSWPAGVTLNLIVNGFVVGRGGNGGRGSAIRYTEQTRNAGEIRVALPGGFGGDAMVIDHDIDLLNNGVIGGGGGGGGGSGFAAVSSLSALAGGRYALAFAVSTGSGGSGGAGSVSGSGGERGERDIVPVNNSNYDYYRGPSTGSGGGFAGALQTGGANSPAASQYSSFTDSAGYFSYASSSTSSGAGAGGDLGQPGGAGRTGTGAGDIRLGLPLVDVTPGAAGGAAGKAIEQTGGASVTINPASTGTILGAIT